MPHIVVLATGGTISSRSHGRRGAVATDTAASIVSHAGIAETGVTVEAVDLLRKNSFSLTMDDLRTITIGIHRQLDRAEVSGIVVTHGTDTIEESAFLADLVHDDARPVVFTGAQLAADREASDGPQNLRDAIALAASPRSRDLGALVSFAGRVFAARGLHKQSTLAASPFATTSSGPLGHVVDSAPRLMALPVHADPLPMPGSDFGNIRVDMIMNHPGADAVLIRSAIEAGARGLVVLGTGTGNLNDSLVAAIADATASGVLVALGTRAASGPVVPMYGGGGGAVDAVAAGAMPIGFLPASQARVLLTLLIDRFPPSMAASLFARYCADDASTHQPSLFPKEIAVPSEKSSLKGQS